LQLSRRKLLGAASTIPLALLAPEALHAGNVQAPDLSSLPPALREIMAKPIYQFAGWQIYVTDLRTGEPVYDFHGSDLVVPGSVTKLFIGAATLAAYGADYRFQTPVYRTGAVDSQGQLAGDLILVASGDLTMGGRDTPDGHIDYESYDHTYANTTDMATLTPEDPLQGLNDLASQVARSGIRHVSGNVIVDARLWALMKKDDYVLSPIMINDNVIDLTITPGGSAGQTASVEWRPQTQAYQVQSQVQTVAAGQPVKLTAVSTEPGRIVVQGQIPADQGSLLRTFQIEDPATFARTLFIEALQRQGVTLDAPATGSNPTGKLPPSASYADAERVALHTSLPFSENLNLIFHVSHNEQADTLVFLLSLKNGHDTFDDGMQDILPFLKTTAVETETVSLGDGRGNDRADLFSPYTATVLLRSMATRPDYPVYREALPVLGEKGLEIDAVAADSPVRGKASAKSGTTAVADLLHQRVMILGRGLAGYMTTRSGRALVFSIYVQNMAAQQLEDVFIPIKDQGTMVEAIFDLN
jgi:D-alanyl-D-alanine carboxypeptidase/D-alanyl-D-alanine-endopeptidase (penicillin-binding protein 4)